MHTTRFRFGLLVCGLLVGVSALAANGTRYKWRDAEGNLHYGDSLPAGAASLGYEIINAQGLIIKRVQRQRTATELAADKVVQAEELARQQQADSQQRDDRQMLAAYPQESDLQHAHQQQLQMLDQSIVSLRGNLKSQEESLADLLGHAADLERADKTVPKKIVDQISELRSSIDTQKQTLARREAERSSSGQRFAEQIAHYRSLRAKQEAARN